MEKRQRKEGTSFRWDEKDSHPQLRSIAARWHYPDLHSRTPRARERGQNSTNIRSPRVNNTESCEYRPSRASRDLMITSSRSWNLRLITRQGAQNRNEAQWGLNRSKSTPFSELNPGSTQARLPRQVPLPHSIMLYLSWHRLSTQYRMRRAATPLSVTVNLVLDIHNALVHRQAGTAVLNLYCENNDTAPVTHMIYPFMI